MAEAGSARAPAARAWASVGDSLIESSMLKAFAMFGPFGMLRSSTRFGQVVWGDQLKRHSAISSPAAPQIARISRSVAATPEPVVAGSNALNSALSRWLTGNTLAISRSVLDSWSLGTSTPEMKYSG